MFIMHEVKGGTRGRETWMFIMHEVKGGLEVEKHGCS